MIAHLTIHNGRLTWSGYGASGDPAHVYALFVDIGRDYILTSQGRLYLTGPGSFQFVEFCPDSLAVAARLGRAGFRVLEDQFAASWESDLRARARRKLGRRGWIAEDQRAGGKG